MSGVPEEWLRSSISSAVKRASRDVYGRGAARARTYLFDEIAFCVLEGGLTPFEQALDRSGGRNLLRRGRAALADTVSRKVAGEVARAAEIEVAEHVSEVLEGLDASVEILLFACSGQEPGGLGPARAEIANATARTVHDHWGKGPARSRAFLADEFVFCVLEEPLTPAERSLMAGGEVELVREMRREFCAIAGAALTTPVEEATGRRVVATASQVVGEPERHFLVFALEERLRAEECPISHPGGQILDEV